MFPTMPVQANKQERQLIKIFKVLDVSNKDRLMVFAEFLQTRSIDSNATLQTQDELSIQPLDIPRPDGESVIQAIKRLTLSYPSVNKESILYPLSELMRSHILQGKEAEKVIDELQALFLQEDQSSKNDSVEL